jgi:glycosyltransferase involved in cell wall biosynthesis
MENKISVILPIKSAKAMQFEDYFNRAITSVTNQKDFVDELVIVHTDETLLTEFIDDYDFSGLSVTKLVWTDTPNFAEQVNAGVKECSGDWVSILEFDDEYSNIWFKNVKNYMNYYKDVKAFLPIVVDVDDKGMFAGFTNEATFAANFTTDLGVLTNEMLQGYQNFQIAGLVINRNSFIDNGGLKSNIKLTFGYEFFLRMTNSNTKFLTIPRIGYKHMNMREGSVFWHYKFGDDRLDESEVRFWIDTAKKEYLFTAQREINYVPEEV